MENLMTDIETEKAAIYLRFLNAKKGTPVKVQYNYR